MTAWMSAVSYPRRNPVTAGYLALLLLTHLWLYQVLAPASRARVLGQVSTNLDNLHRDPVGCLVGSALFFDGTLTRVTTLSFIGTLITLVLGIGGALAWCERRWGPLRAYAVFLAGHVGATLITAPIIGYGIAHGWYPPSVRHALDYGISYGAQAVLAATVVLLPRALRPWWVLFVIGWPLPGADWHGWVPDFTTVGHLVAASIGFLAVLVAPCQRSTDTAATSTVDGAT
jgi:hypothetical protein